MGAPLKYKSEVKNWSGTSGASVDFPEFVEQRGPRGGRVVVDKFSLHFRGDVTVATAALLGEDWYRFFRTVTVEQKDGVRRYNEMPGEALRHFSFLANGPDRTKEHADSGVSANQILTATCLIGMEKRYAKRPRDFSMAADVFKSLKIGCARGTEMSLGTSVVTINSGTYWVIAECHEEMDVVQHSIDEVFVREFDTTTTCKVQVDGRLHDLILYQGGAQAEGGGALTNLTEAWIEHLQPQALLVTPDLQEHYARARNIVTGAGATQGAVLRSDPFVLSTPRAVAVLLSDGNKVYEQPVRDTVTIKTTQASAVAGLVAICRVIRPRSERLERALQRKYRFTAARPKTDDKTQRSPGSWADEYLAYLPAKAVKGR